MPRDPLHDIFEKLGFIQSDIKAVKTENLLAAGSRTEIHKSLDVIKTDIHSLKLQMVAIVDQGNRIDELEGIHAATKHHIDTVPELVKRIDALESQADQRLGRAAMRGTFTGLIVGTAAGAGGAIASGTVVAWIKAKLGW